MDYKMADKLIEQRKKHGLSQESLADKLNISRQAVSKWERAETAPDTDNLIALSKLYGITIDEILGINNRQQYPDESDILSERSFFMLTPKDKLIAKIIAGLALLIIGFVFFTVGIGMYIGFAVPENKDLRFSKNESLAVRTVTVTDISRSNLNNGFDGMYSIIFVLDGKKIKTNPIYTQSEAEAKVGETIEVRVDGNGHAVMLDYERSGYSLLGFIFLGVLGGIGIIFLPTGVVLLRLAQIQKRKNKK